MIAIHHSNTGFNPIIKFIEYKDKLGFGIPLREFMSSKVFQKKWNNTIAPSIKKPGVFKIQEVSK